MSDYDNFSEALLYIMVGLVALLASYIMGVMGAIMILFHTCETNGQYKYDDDTLICSVEKPSIDNQ